MMKWSDGSMDNDLDLMMMMFILMAQVTTSDGLILRGWHLLPSQQAAEVRDIVSAPTIRIVVVVVVVVVVVGSGGRKKLKVLPPHPSTG